MKSNTPDKQAVLRAIVSAAQVYERDLVGRAFLYVFEGKHIEVTYRIKDFKHLTGVETTSYATPFYKDALHNKLRPGQFKFTSRHPYDLCVRKMQHLFNLPVVIRTDLIILERVTTNTKTYEFGFTELNFILCLDKDLDPAGQPKSNYYVPESLRDEDAFNRSGTQYECNYIFSKLNTEKYYNVLCYSDGKIDIADLPNEIKKHLSSTLVGQEQQPVLST